MASVIGIWLPETTPSATDTATRAAKERVNRKNDAQTTDVRLSAIRMRTRSPLRSLVAMMNGAEKMRASIATARIREIWPEFMPIRSSQTGKPRPPMITAAAIGSSTQGSSWKSMRLFERSANPALLNEEMARKMAS